MIKPAKLRERLTQSISFFKNNPERLQLFYNNGKVRLTGANSLSYEYHYDLEIIVEDFPNHPDLLFVPIAEFIRTHQAELLLNYDRQQITFEIDPNNNKTYDIFIKVPLTERVIIKLDNKQYIVEHAEEPEPDEWQPIEKISIYAQGELIYERHQTN